MMKRTVGDRGGGGVDVHVLDDRERRMLLEALAEERAGFTEMRVGAFWGREDTARRLCGQGFASWSSPGEISLTRLGRHLAERLAVRLVQRRSALHAS
jgi:hypothetical protein